MGYEASRKTWHFGATPDTTPPLPDFFVGGEQVIRMIGTANAIEEIKQNLVNLPKMTDRKALAYFTKIARVIPRDQTDNSLVFALHWMHSYNALQRKMAMDILYALALRSSTYALLLLRDIANEHGVPNALVVQDKLGLLYLGVETFMEVLTTSSEVNSLDFRNSLKVRPWIKVLQTGVNTISQNTGISEDILHQLPKRLNRYPYISA